MPHLQARSRIAVALSALLVAAATATAAVPRDLVRPWAGVVSAGRGAPAPTADVVVLFRLAPAADRPGALTGTKATAAARADQDRALEHLARRGLHLTVIDRFTRTVNAVIARVPSGERARLLADRSVAGIFAVRPVFPAGVAESALPSLGPGALPLHSPIGPGGGIEIAVLDGPVDTTHPVLAGRVDYPAGATPPSASIGADHGTAMAALAAGGAGPVGWLGVAPAARVLAIQVLTPGVDGGLVGTTADLLRGLELVADPNADGDLSDHARVALAAVSAPFGGFADTPEAVAIDALDHLGTVVVAAAGNDGPTSGRLGSLSSPGSAPAALTIGASDGRQGLPQVPVAVDGGGLAERLATAPLVYGLAPVAGLPLPVRLVDPATPPAPGSLAGAAALVARDGADVRAAVRAAALAGASTILVYGDPIPAGAFGVDDRVPVAVVALPASTGAAAASAVGAGAAVSVTFGASSYAPNQRLGSVAPFSSTGPGYAGQAKPDLVLPGVAVLSAAPYGQWSALSGTSVAAAQAAGETAALAAIHPDWSAGELRSALVSTARQVAGVDGNLAPVEQQGGGEPDLAAAAGVGVFVSPATLSFGRMVGNRAEAGLTVRNPGASPVDVTLALQRDGGGGALGIRVNPARFVLAPGAALLVPIALTIDVVDPADPVVGGWVVVMLGDGRSLRVPFTAIAAPAAGHPLKSVTLSRNRVARPTAAATPTVTLSVDLGDVAVAGDVLDITPITALEIDLRRHGRSTVLYAARDLNPGLYRYQVSARDARGRPLGRGSYLLVVRAVSVDGVSSTRQLRLRVR